MSDPHYNYKLNQAIADATESTWPLLARYGWFASAIVFAAWYFSVVPRATNALKKLIDGTAYDMEKIRELDEKMRIAREAQAAVAEVESKEFLERRRKKDEEARIKAADDLDKRAVKNGLRSHRGGHRLGGGE